MCEGNKKCSKCKISSIGMVKRNFKARNLQEDKIPFERLAAVGAGAVGSRMLGVKLKQMKYFVENPKMAKAIPIAKVGLGVGLQLQDNKIGQDFGLGILADGAMDALETFFPDTFKVSGLNDYSFPYGAQVAGGDEVIELTLLPDGQGLAGDYDRLNGDYDYNRVNGDYDNPHAGYYPEMKVAGGVF